MIHERVRPSQAALISLTQWPYYPNSRAQTRWHQCRHKQRLCVSFGKLGITLRRRPDHSCQRSRYRECLLRRHIINRFNARRFLQDHLVPLKEVKMTSNLLFIKIFTVDMTNKAWLSGARDWTPAQREAFANDLTRPQLVAITDKWVSLQALRTYRRSQIVLDVKSKWIERCAPSPYRSISKKNWPHLPEIQEIEVLFSPSV